ncbi:DEAD/DEAH box helicase [Marinicella meishanensis]|uniref:DEAD/DEAH box helicase n=1 Tax=Marinicella meishanensis TaxID=2873263 RepID=UPI001CC005DB|nr:DEAD/DEAH box helicase [Marinicella sp. NBU2979]
MDPQTTKFSALKWAPELAQAIADCGYQDMTPVQQLAIPAALTGQDLVVLAQTGTGKTAAFALPVLQQLLNRPKAPEPGQTRALILTPTRELAEQLAQTIGAYAQHTDCQIQAIYGGVKMGGQARQLQAGLDVLIATPGRLLEHLALEHLYLSQVECVVLDEADRMLDMGFIDDAKQILGRIKSNHQSLLFSATTSAALTQAAQDMMRRPQVLSVNPANATADTVEHVMYPVEEGRKLDLFMDLLQQHNWFQILVFTSTRKQADHLLARLKQTEVPTAICHGDISQGGRRRALADFKAGRVQVLIATEVAARGLDIVGLDHVLNYNLPYLPEDYVHRIGRTGRAGHAGHAMSFVCPEETRVLHRIERLLGAPIKRIYVKGYELSGQDIESVKTHAPAKPAKRRANSNTKRKPSKGKKTTSGRRQKKPISARAGGKKNRKSKKR